MEMNCPGCGKSGLKQVGYLPFIAKHGDVWECPNCTLLSTDFAVYMYNRHWKRCAMCEEINHHLYEWRGEKICYSCMDSMGLIGL